MILLLRDNIVHEQIINQISNAIIYTNVIKYFEYLQVLMKTFDSDFEPGLLDTNYNPL